MRKRVTCLNCSTDVYELVADISSSDPIEANQFKGINGYPSPEGGSMISCPACGDVRGIRRGLELAVGLPLDF